MFLFSFVFYLLFLTQFYTSSSKYLEPIIVPYEIVQNSTSSSVHRDENLLFFNRIPKVGSQMMMSLLTKLGSRNNFDFYRDGGHKYLQLRLGEDEQVILFAI
jgi:hypothetical protein